MKKNKRFEVTHEEKVSMMHTISIIKDRKTGIQYLFNNYGGYPGGVTVLLNEDGKPLIDDNNLDDPDDMMDLHSN